MKYLQVVLKWKLLENFSKRRTGELWRSERVDLRCLGQQLWRVGLELEWASLTLFKFDESQLNEARCPFQLKNKLLRKMCLFWSLTIGLILNLISADHLIKYDILSFTFQTVLSNERKCGQACFNSVTWCEYGCDYPLPFALFTPT